ncbi:myeloid-derived growth factor-like [Huso huso]|uniref:Myeloid-derived growth factor-like n=1 Tax=Huso huso TaxID=61971 RepID=A0ABR0Y4B0_HUSHU|nr:myeloid-derived growth factor-like [Acipenser ruthenus]XP_034767716.1 myeloid-derived growth factor-like [Acipenser ruthenus]
MASTSGCKLSASPVLFVLNVALILLLITAKSASASQERTKTEEFNVRPGGVVHSFSQKMGEYSCSFTYASQGGTNEQWQMSVGLSEDDRLFSCSVWRPQGKSYLFFTQFKAEVTGAKIEYGSAFSQAAVGGNKDVALKAEEYTVGESTVTHNEGKFRAELSKLTIIARTRHDEL